MLRGGRGTAKSAKRERDHDPTFSGELRDRLIMVFDIIMSEFHPFASWRF